MNSRSSPGVFLAGLPLLLLLAGLIAGLLAGCEDSRRAQPLPAGSVRETSAESAQKEAEPASGPALLESGPVKRYGILVLPPNAIGHYQGLYKEDRFAITVLYTQESIVIPADWVTQRCGGDPVRFTLENDAIHYLYASQEGWYTFFTFPGDYGKDCAFIERFLQRLRYFKSVAGSGEPAPLPAIIETS